jgi:tripartite-type tricarboxylate transporter receptor subunit TctC
MKQSLYTRRSAWRQTAAGLTLATLSLCVSSTWAQTTSPANTAVSTWPNKPIKFIVPFASGGANDLLARAAAEGATKVLGQPVVIDNKPGAGGTLGTMLGIKSAPDGYTFLISAAGVISNTMIKKIGTLQRQRIGAGGHDWLGTLHHRHIGQVKEHHLEGVH